MPNPTFYEQLINFFSLALQAALAHPADTARIQELEAENNLLHDQLASVSGLAPSVEEREKLNTLLKRFAEINPQANVSGVVPSSSTATTETTPPPSPPADPAQPESSNAGTGEQAGGTSSDAGASSETEAGADTTEGEASSDPAATA